ncbi:glycoside hydrolase family 43 protein [Actinotalea fermentans]|uniref:Glycoside hydrolase 43 family protein n=1 Tax=Actinotalea fermentans TaxID=43671 RepID=A0A511Z2C5_9CELL|nr:glycoside hydrolase family 43 protein [Actinotalea fermentans]GEN81597.1 glycoside hydrolase 43 family protein [Actinotalea fermentans]
MTEVRTFTNPVIPGFHPDPSICRVGGEYFLVTSSFEYFPGLPIFTSRDLVSWQPLGHVLDRESQLDLTRAPASGGIFAPTIRHHDGRFYVTATNVSDRGHFIVHAEDPAGPWSDPVWVDQNGIDPSLFFDEGHVYFTSNIEPDPAGPHVADPHFERGIQQSLVDPLTGAVLQEPRFIWGGTGGRYPEAPHLFRRGSFYYLVISEGGTEYGHMVTVGRSTSPWGPFAASPHGPIVSHRSIVSPFQAVGHADLVTLPNGDWWMVCLGVRPVGQWPRHLLGRETLLAAVRWTPDGWPIVGERAVIEVDQTRPALPAAPPPRHVVRDDFDAATLGPEWAFVRRPMAPEAILARPGWLTLSPRTGLAERFPCFVGRRQQHYDFVAETRLVLDAREDGDEAGIAVRMNEEHFYALGLRRAGAAMEAVLRTRLGRLDITSVVGVVEGPDVVISVEGSADSYTFSVSDSSGRVARTQPRDAKFLSAEFAGGFTGVFVGMYAATSSAGSGTVARFDWFDYRPAPRASSHGQLDREDSCHVAAGS